MCLPPFLAVPMPIFFNKQQSRPTLSTLEGLWYHNDPVGPPPRIDGFLGQQSTNVSRLRTLSLHRSGQPTVALVKNDASGDRAS